MTGLEEMNGLPTYQVRRDGVCRRDLIAKAADELEASRTDVNVMIQTAMGYELLGNGAAGSLSYRAVLELAKMVRRATDSESRPKDGRNWSEAERWVIQEKFADKARAIFDKAIQERWSGRRARGEMHRLGLGHKGKGRRVSPPQRIKPCLAASTVNTSPRDDLLSQAARGSPGDVAALCMELVEKAESPSAVAIRLRVMLARYLPVQEKKKSVAV